MKQLPHICVIGAGSSGIAACKVFQDQEIPVDCFEKSDRIGGNWAFKNNNGMSSAYRSLHINTSRRQMVYSDFPMRDGTPDFPHHTQVIQYFNDYVEHFGLKKYITLNCGVAKCELTTDSTWKVELDDRDVRYYDALCVANGHHWDPRWPDPPYPGKFSGEQLHSHSYIDPTEPVDCIDKNIVIVGMGNSALDIACELGHKGVARNVFLSVRRGYYIVPKYLGSETLDADDPHPSEDPPLIQRLTPTWLARWRRRRHIESVVGRPEDYGLPQPNYPLGQTHPTISNEILIRIGSGDVIPKPNIANLDGEQIEFQDGTRENVDVLIYATGYNIKFPFFDSKFLSAPNNEIPLYKRIMHPKHHNLFFLALIQPLCATMPIAEEQSKWVAAHLTGACALPPQSRIDKETLAYYQTIKRKYLDTPRHTIQINNCAAYAYGLRKDMHAGRNRANRLRNKPQGSVVHTNAVQNRAG
ncbi:MAG: NAD(P)-binding domain-containing protein [Gammaproteobacteria bacterium]|nr:NAD(P)-binding domain-containing protein [Gammaproteobacteria bacterium]